MRLRWLVGSLVLVAIGIGATGSDVLHWMQSEPAREEVRQTGDMAPLTLLFLLIALCLSGAGWMMWMILATWRGRKR